MGVQSFELILPLRYRVQGFWHCQVARPSTRLAIAIDDSGGSACMDFIVATSWSGANRWYPSQHPGGICSGTPFIWSAWYVSRSVSSLRIARSGSFG
jgi:hypothetical protein